MRKLSWRMLLAGVILASLCEKSYSTGRALIQNVEERQRIIAVGVLGNSWHVQTVEVPLLRRDFGSLNAESSSPQGNRAKEQASERRAAMQNSLSGMVMPVVMVLMFLLIITLMKECARMMWRRALLRTISKLKANQVLFVGAGTEFPEGEAPLLESGRWSIKWQDGHRERYTSLTLRVDPVMGTFMGTGRDSSGECIIEGCMNARRDRIAWTQTYSLRRQQMHIEAWGFLRRDGEIGPVVGRGQYQTSDALGSRGTFVLRPVLVESIITQIMERFHLQPPPPRRAPVSLRPLPADCQKVMDMTCAICLEDNTPPPTHADESRGEEEAGAKPSGMLTCGHAFHKECIEKWLHHHDECPTCKHVVREQAAAAANSNADEDDGFVSMSGLRPSHLGANSHLASDWQPGLAAPSGYYPAVIGLSGSGMSRGPMVLRLERLGEATPAQGTGHWNRQNRLIERLLGAREVNGGETGGGLRQLDSGLQQLERSLASLENEVRNMVDRMPVMDVLDLERPDYFAHIDASELRMWRQQGDYNTDDELDESDGGAPSRPSHDMHPAMVTASGEPQPQPQPQPIDGIRSARMRVLDGDALDSTRQGHERAWRIYQAGTPGTGDADAAAEGRV